MYFSRINTRSYESLLFPCDFSFGAIALLLLLRVGPRLDGLEGRWRVSDAR